VQLFRQVFHVAEDRLVMLDRLLSLLGAHYGAGRQVHDTNIVTTMLSRVLGIRPSSWSWRAKAAQRGGTRAKLGPFRRDRIPSRAMTPCAQAYMAIAPPSTWISEPVM
jgi:hypothetical protein